MAVTVLYIRRTAPRTASLLVVTWFGNDPSVVDRVDRRTNGTFITMTTRVVKNSIIFELILTVKNNVLLTVVTIILIYMSISVLRWLNR